MIVRIHVYVISILLPKVSLTHGNCVQLTSQQLEKHLHTRLRIFDLASKNQPCECKNH